MRTTDRYLTAAASAIAGLLLGLTLAWITRPDLIFGIRPSLEDIARAAKAGDSYAATYIIRETIGASIGLLLGAVIGWYATTYRLRKA